MKKFHKAQILSSVLPGISTLVVSIITVVQLKRKKAGSLFWILFSIVFFGTGILFSIIDVSIPLERSSVLRAIVMVCVFALANMAFVKLQIECSTQEGTPKERVSKKKSLLTGRKLTVIFVVLGILFLMIFAIGAVIMGVSNYREREIADINGVEDTSLAVLTLDKIITTMDDYTMLAFGAGSSGQRSLVEGDLAQYDYDVVRFYAGTVSGIHTLQATKTQAERMTLQIESELERGNMAIVIIVDGEFYCYAELSTSYTITLDKIRGKTIIVRMAAESAKMDIEVIRSFP